MTVTTADYEIRATAAYTSPFAFNELVEVVDDKGQPTGQKGRFFGIEINLFDEPTGSGYVSIVNGPSRAIPFKNLKSLKH